ncbi:DUF4328 domain-containing protein [Streptomyces sp. NBC_01476]|uniref:DUF4328 domain-containing protein n=1 Tax=Streptomyces sp. NBC_01476 TaxID=2903881 RepID=UPI002E30F6FF|nr:DUF4328 domain-containing protein [Streptomyces sp. NBC_01476]
MKCANCGTPTPWSSTGRCAGCSWYTPYAITDKRPEYRDPGRLATFAVAMLAVALLADAFYVVASARMVSMAGDLLVGSPDVTNTRIESVFNMRTLALRVHYGSLIAAAVPFVVWFRRARLNAEVFAPTAMRTNSGMAIGAWIIPIANLWMGRKIANDIDRAVLVPVPEGPQVGRRAAGRTGPARALLNIWWALWIGSIWGGLGYSLVGEPIAIMTADDADSFSLDQLHGEALGDVVSNSIGVLAAVAAILVVRRITALQRARATTFLVFPAREGQPVV